jgi:hypothetical protein
VIIGELTGRMSRNRAGKVTARGGGAILAATYR